MHSKPELLAPAGGPEPFAAALAAGADAIYCGMGEFNARRKAHNFSDEDFERACRAAHLAGARVYVTVNIVIKDAEMAQALELVRRCTVLGADAFIIQDWGLFSEIRRLMPQVETHISTQANIHDARGAAWCKERGADRVTLSRELSVAEIAAIAPVGIDLEVFAHGSICICYSGVCTLSSFACAGRSANRGMCAQPCRLPYHLVDEKGRAIEAPGRERPLCPRDTNTSEMLPALLDAGAHALKLEGRMKAPDYVYSIVDAYRRQLDDVEEGRTPAKSELAARRRQLKRCFNRDFTTEYQQGRSGDEMMSYERSNNRGQLVGRVLGSTVVGGGRGLKPDDRRNKVAIAKLALDEPVGKGDLLELRHDDAFDQFLTVLAPDDAKAGSTIEVRIPRAMPKDSKVRVIRSQRAIDTAAAALKRDVLRRRAVDVRVKARLGEPFEVSLACADDPSLSASVTGFVVEPARTRPVSREDLIEHVGRMGSSPFEARSFEVELDEGCGMGFSAVHKVRAAACEALIERILEPHQKLAREVGALSPMDELAVTASSVQGESAGERTGESAGKNAGESAGESGTASGGHWGENLEVCALVSSVEAAEVARTAGATRVYVTTDALDEEGLDSTEAVKRGLVPQLDEVCRQMDHDRLDRWVRSGASLAVGNISELALACERAALPEVRPCIPVHNVACIQALEDAGAAGFWLSPELTLEEIERIAPHAKVPVGLVVFGRPRVMTTEHCILQAAGACIDDCPRCGLRRRRLSLKNIDDKLLPVRTDIHGRSHLFDAFPIDITPQVDQLARAGVTRFAVDGRLMDADELSRAVARAARAVEAARAGRRPAPRMRGATSGCLFVGVS